MLNWALSGYLPYINISRDAGSHRSRVPLVTVEVQNILSVGIDILSSEKKLIAVGLVRAGRNQKKVGDWVQL